MDEDAAWLARLLDACERALVRLAEIDSPPRGLVDDIGHLREQLLGRLGGQRRDATSGDAKR
jgi:hypothetical protein